MSSIVHESVRRVGPVWRWTVQVNTTQLAGWAWTENGARARIDRGMRRLLAEAVG